MIDTEEFPPEPIKISPSTPAQKPFFIGTMPLPPSIDDSYQRQFKRDIVQFKYDAALMLSQAEHDYSLINAIRSSAVKVPLAVKLRIYFRTMWKSDVDNRIKYAIDAAFNRIDLDDRLVVDLHVTKEADPIRPRVEIEISVVVR